MIGKLLILGSCMPHKSPVGKFQIGTGIIERFINEEIFLFYPEGWDHFCDILVKELADINCRLVDLRK